VVPGRLEVVQQASPPRLQRPELSPRLPFVPASGFPQTCRNLHGIKSGTFQQTRVGRPDEVGASSAALTSIASPCRAVRDAHRVFACTCGGSRAARRPPGHRCPVVSALLRIAQGIICALGYSSPPSDFCNALSFTLSNQTKSIGQSFST
jgi:hypothetical protein